MRCRDATVMTGNKGDDVPVAESDRPMRALALHVADGSIWVLVSQGEGIDARLHVYGVELPR